MDLDPRVDAGGNGDVMSMIAIFKQISPRLLAALESDSSLVPAVIDLGTRSIQTNAGPLPVPAHLKAMIDQMPEDQKAQFYDSLSEQWGKMMSDPSVSAIVQTGRDTSTIGHSALRDAGISEEDTAGDMSIEKAWHGLHYLLCGQADRDESPLGIAILGGSEIGDDLGYGPARCLSPEEVRSAAAALKQLTEDSLKSRYDAAAMTAQQIYPGGWEDSENVDWLLDAARQVRNYYNEAAARGYGMLLYLT